MTTLDPTYAQDELRPARQFVSLLSGVFEVFDQTYAGQDGMAYNFPRSYQTIGPYGTSVEGVPSVISTTSAGGLVISPMMVMIAVGFAAAMIWKR